MTQKQDDYKKGDEYQLIKGIAQELALALSIIPLPDRIKAAPLGRKINELLDLSREILGLPGDGNDDMQRADVEASTTPGTIYLQINPDWTPESNYPQFEGVTWSVDRENSSDVLYVRAVDPVELAKTLPSEEAREG